MKQTLSDFCAFLRREDTDDICFACHVSPDGDTVGSAAALARLAHTLGKRAFVRAEEPIPENLAFLLESFDNTPFDPRVVVAVDVSAPHRLGEDFPYAERVCYVLDHHKDNSFSCPALVDETAAACALLVAQVYDALGVPFDADCAEALYTALSTDTGRFCHQNTDARVFSLAARLAAASREGNFSALNRRLFVERDPALCRLEAYVLSHATLNEGQGYVYFCLTRRLRRRFGLLSPEKDTSSLIDVLRSFSGYSLVCLAKEVERGVYKLSLRSETQDVRALCATFGGGGHVRAAGCTVRAASPRALERKLSHRAKEVFQ